MTKIVNYILWAIASGATFWVFANSEFPYAEVWIIWTVTLTISGVVSARTGSIAAPIALGTLVSIVSIYFAGIHDFVTARLLAAMLVAGPLAFAMAVGIDMIRFAIWGSRS
ncbi:hypothetical protein FRD01_23910 [Microvenator marinus]|uniref:Uncharacterized protein n=1 Tax=Microvenator marinus TaxID=2600177 RepID=A0A5B8XYC4_9DELT|nr:hypothetical protein [Microvenator marinus]QED30221.1 hypothetical protein FRD01_23910 [Microvenator marinus]